jgi:hypothetical protein
MQSLKRFRRLGGPQRRIVLAAITALTATWLSLRFLGFRRSNALFARFMPPSINRVDDGSASLPPQEIARLTYATARSLPLVSNCLDRSLALCWLLRRRGIAARLRIGARKDGAQLKAHAWVESDGVALGDADEEHRHFVPFEPAAASIEAGTQ